MAAYTEHDSDVQVEMMTLEELTLELNKNGTITPSTIDAIEHHAAALGADVCAQYRNLNHIVTRYEALLRKRWIKKSTTQRRDLLFTAWPGMQRDYCPENQLDPMPYINLENLSKAKPLLIYLNAQGRHTPWNFACTEEELCSFGRTSPCMDEAFCKKTTITFTKNLDPHAYGSINRGRDPNQCYQSKDDCYELCARSSIQILRIQDKILRFLVNCALMMLRDIPEDQLLSAPVQEEPSLTDIVDGDFAGHTTFSNVLMSAPYRGWHSLNFKRLQGYIRATLDTQKDHIRALREDPGYFADTLLEYEEHAPYNGANSVGLDFQFSDVKTYQKKIVMIILNESHAMLCGWTDLDRKFDEFHKLVQEEGTMHDQRQVTAEINHIAREMKDMLASKVSNGYLAAPNIRKLLRQPRKRDLSTNWLTPKIQLTEDQAELLRLLGCFEDPHLGLVTPAVITAALESVDRVLQRSTEANKMMSVRLLSLLTDLSVLGECIRQINLWKNAPDARKSGSGHIGRNRLLDSKVSDFNNWWDAAKEMSVPTHHVYPFKEKLYYPVHKRRTRKNIEAMREAEKNLDKFWAQTDSFCEAKTGTRQLGLVRDCLLEGGELDRTAPWVEPTVDRVPPVKKPEDEYQQLSRMVHDKTLEITGSFDRLSIAEKMKTKTRGVGDPTPAPDHHLAVQLPGADSRHGEDQTLLIDQRAHKVFKTLFHNPSSNIVDLPKMVKWVEFKRAMGRVGFSVEKLQGSAWQFTPGDTLNTDRSIQFHEPHPDSDIPYIMARRFGRRLGRVYGWNSDTFRLA